jgi:hypothetical protein
MATRAGSAAVSPARATVMPVTIPSPGLPFIGPQQPFTE